MIEYCILMYWSESVYCRVYTNRYRRKSKQDEYMYIQVDARTIQYFQYSRILLVHDFGVNFCTSVQIPGDTDGRNYQCLLRYFSYSLSSCIYLYLLFISDYSDYDSSTCKMRLISHHTNLHSSLLQRRFNFSVNCFQPERPEVFSL